MTPRVSIVMPAYNEGPSIVPVLERLVESVQSSHEVLVVVDSPDDPTRALVDEFAKLHPAVSCVVNTYGRGPARAIRYGMDIARAPVIVVTMADGSDDPRLVDPLVSLVERGVVIAAASRYMPGGRQIGGAVLKRLLSRIAGVLLYLLARVGTHDGTNSFKAYSADFVREVGIDSDAGFEIGLELVAKARRLRRPVAEIPTIWIDRREGASNFKLWSWIPHYLRWWRFAFGRRLSVHDLRRLATAKENAR